ncbi:YdcF family protein [Isoptericola nanjingensis]|uniref:YdcF family protein n=1 Tax=Isoptericola nanjingensis TaxID=903413 RepID=UPI003D254092
MDDAQILWDYHQMHHEPRNTDIAIGLGSHDIGVAEHTAELWHEGRFPLIVFSGANAPTTVEVFPRGEAVHYAERAKELGVPADAILTETRATNTGENFTLTRELLNGLGIHPQSATIISRPYQQRRAYATARKLWPGIDLVCSARDQALEDYIDSIGDANRVIDMLVGDTQRIWVYSSAGYAIHQDVDELTFQAYRRLVDAGFIERLVQEGRLGEGAV